MWRGGGGQREHELKQHHKTSLATQIESHAENHTGVTIYDKEEPRSVYNLVSAQVQAAIENISPYLYSWSEKALERHAKLETRDYQLRLSFWNEYNFAQDNFKPTMSIDKITRGVCSKQYFYETVLRDYKKLAWILYPPSDYTITNQELFDRSTREIRRILQMPITKKGKVDHALIREKVKIHLALENRVKGAVVKNIAVAARHQHSVAAGGSATEAPKSLQEIEKEIKQLEAKTKTSDVQPVIDVTAESKSPDSEGEEAGALAGTGDDQ